MTDRSSDHDLQADPAPILRLSENEIQILADRLFSRGISNITAYSRRQRADLIDASRTLRAVAAIRKRNWETRSDLALAASVIFTLIRTGVIAGPVDLGGRRDG